MIVEPNKEDIMEDKKIDCIIGIDCGAQGGIAVYRIGEPVKTFKMPKELALLQEFIEHYKEIAHPIVFIEKINVRHDDYNGNMGKIFRIQKMVANYEQVKTAIELSGVPFAQVHPMKWQNALRLRIKGEEKPARKKRYKEIAQDYYKEVKATMWNCDALLIMHFGRWVMKNDTKWLKTNIPTKYANLWQK